MHDTLHGKGATHRPGLVGSEAPGRLAGASPRASLPDGPQPTNDAVHHRPPEGAPRPSDRSLAVCTRGLTKHYRNPWTLRTYRGVQDLDLEVHRGEVMGYLGPNGAGKTTTLKLLTGLHRPTRGEAWLLGEPVDRTASRARIGFLPEQPYFYDYLSGLEYLEFAGRLSGLDAREALRRAARWLDRVGLGERPRLRLRKYSKGMLQRLGLAAALIHEPELLILDEPMSDLDPFGRRDVRELVLEQRQRGTTVLFSSHILPDVEMLCDRVAIVFEGRLRRVATIGELVGEHRQRIEIRCEGAPVLELPARLEEHLERRERPDGTAFVLDDERLLNDALGWLMAHGVTLRAVTPQRATLEQLFLEATDAVLRIEPAAQATRSA
jgi:ABC-2 type transport system ATP-binding protein